MNTSAKIQMAIKYTSAELQKLYATRESRITNRRMISAYEAMSNMAAKYQLSDIGEENYLKYLNSCLDPQNHEPSDPYYIAAENVLKAIQ